MFGKDEYVIVPMNFSHLRRVAEIEKNSFGMKNVKSYEVWGKETYRDDLYEDNSRYFSAIYHRKVVGYACLMLVAGEGHITKIAVDAAFRGKGIGEALMEELMLAGDKENVSYYYLEVRASNEAARELYTKFGFRLTGKRPHYYIDNNEDAYVYEKGEIPN